MRYSIQYNAVLPSRRDVCVCAAITAAAINSVLCVAQPPLGDTPGAGRRRTHTQSYFRLTSVLAVDCERGVDWWGNEASASRWYRLIL